ncbi:hypothetical protein [Pseudoalteromonas sp. SCSIO 43201]
MDNKYESIRCAFCHTFTYDWLHVYTT